MNKIKLENILIILLIGLVGVTIFIYFCPMLEFTASQDGKDYLFALDGMSLITKDSVATYWNDEEFIKLKGVTFARSNVILAAFVILFVMLAIIIASFIVKPYRNINKFSYPTITLLAIINIGLSCFVLETFPTPGFQLFQSYGLTLLIVFNVFIFLSSAAISFISFKKAKEVKD